MTPPIWNRWARIVSWHAVSPDGTRTLCGRSLNRTQAGNVRAELPADEKSCESCLRAIVS